MNNFFRFNTSVYYEDTDSSGFVYHTSYLKFAERGRSEMIKYIFPKISEIISNSNFFFVVKDLSVKYIKPLVLFDKVVIETKIIKLNKASLELQQDIFKNNSNYCSIEVKLVWINKKDGKPIRIPSNLMASLNQIKIV